MGPETYKMCQFLGLEIIKMGQQSFRPQKLTLWICFWAQKLTLWARDTFCKVKLLGMGRWELWGFVFVFYWDLQFCFLFALDLLFVRFCSLKKQECIHSIDAVFIKTATYLINMTELAY